MPTRYRKSRPSIKQTVDYLSQVRYEGKKHTIVHWLCERCSLSCLQSNLCPWCMERMQPVWKVEA